MNKKGFTLVELLGVLVLLIAVFLIIVPVVDKSIKDSKEKLYNNQIDGIKNSMKLWVDENQKPDVTESITLSLYQLKQSGLIDVDIKDPKTNKNFPNDAKLTITNNEGVLEFTVDFDNANNISDYENLPKLSLVGNALEYVELGSNYNEKGTNETSTITGEVGDSLGTYLITYEIVDGSVNNKIYRTVVVKDTTSPEISFNNSNLTISNTNDDFTSDITVKDNSCININNCTNAEYEIEVDKSNLLSSSGKYSIKYIVTDKNGNETIKYRNITVN